MNRKQITSQFFTFLNWLKQIGNQRKIFTALFIVLILLNLLDFISRIQNDWHKLYKPHLVYFPGLRFAGLDTELKDQQYIGYLSDYDLNKPKYLKRFLRAQFALAPAVLVKEATEYEYMFLDFSSNQKAQEKLEEIDARAIKINNFGIILAKK